MASKKKRQKKTTEPQPRNPVAEVARKRSSAGFMKSKSEKRVNRKSWKKLLDKLIEGE